MPNSSNLLAFANVQMAAEVLFGLADGGPGSVFSGGFDSPQRLAFLTEGNNRASKFTMAQATEFAQIWEVVEHKSNMPTGFSGTLFRVRADAPQELLGRYGLEYWGQIQFPRF